MRVSIRVGGIDRASLEDRIGWIRQVQSDKSTIPIGEEDQFAIIRRLCTMSVICVSIASLASVEWTADILNAPIRNLKWIGRISDVE